MDELKLIESLDSLWFFTNIFSSSITKPLSTKSDTPKSDPSESITSIPQIHQTQSRIDNIAVEECPKCVDLAAENGESRETEEEEEEEKKRERRTRINRKKRRLKSDFDQRRRVVKWLDFSFDLNEIDEFCMMMMMIDGKSKACGYDVDGDGKMMDMMPSFSDEMAMREHLKSWAYSVACAVK